MSKTEEQAREYLRERNITNSIIKHNEIIEGNFVQTVATLEDVITDFANSQHEQLTKERDELKEEINYLKGRPHSFDIYGKLQAEKKITDALKDWYKCGNHIGTELEKILNNE